MPGQRKNWNATWFQSDVEMAQELVHFFLKVIVLSLRNFQNRADIRKIIDPVSIAPFFIRDPGIVEFDNFGVRAIIDRKGYLLAKLLG